MAAACGEVSRRGAASGLILLLLTIWSLVEVKGEEFTQSVFLDNPNPTQPDTYLNTVQPFDNPDQTYYIIGFKPTVTMDFAHHMIASGCTSITKDQNGNSVCVGKSIIYAWGRDAPPLQLPKGVGFKIGKGSRYAGGIHLEIHFGEVPKPGTNLKNRGVILLLTDVPQPKTAAVILMGTGGRIQPQTAENFEVACPMKLQEGHEMHIFAFRPHTHKLGKKVSGYVVHRDAAGYQEWKLIGTKDPQKPQMFYPATSPDIVVKSGDLLAARCEMFNFRDHVVQVGSTSQDEMCNFYAMYWVEDEQFPGSDACWSNGPPDYYWAKDTRLSNLPIQSSGSFAIELVDLLGSLFI